MTFTGQELEPFPEIKIFDELREFHEDLCREYSPRDHLLKVRSLNIGDNSIVAYFKLF